VPLVRRRRVASVALDGGEVETEQIAAVLFGATEGVGQAVAVLDPFAAERLVGLEEQRVVPGPLVVVRDQDVRESGNALAAVAIGSPVAEQEAEPVTAADAE
jgi:hypothetical protein